MHLFHRGHVILLAKSTTLVEVVRNNQSSIDPNIKAYIVLHRFIWYAIIPFHAWKQNNNLWQIKANNIIDNYSNKKITMVDTHTHTHRCSNIWHGIWEMVGRRPKARGGAAAEPRGGGVGQWTESDGGELSETLWWDIWAEGSGSKIRRVSCHERNVDHPGRAMLPLDFWLQTLRSHWGNKLIQINHFKKY